MPKAALKKNTASNQKNKCAITKKKLPKKTELYDTHRKTPKNKGGDYTKDNTIVTLPVAHMKEHGTYKERDEELENIKMIIDDREQVRKLFNKINNQLLALKRGTDKLSELTMTWLENQKNDINKKLREIDKELTKAVKNLENPLAKAALKVRGIGPVTVAYCLVYIELDGIFPDDHIRAGQQKARHASSLWKYTGLDCASHERYKKGETSGGNKTLRTVLYTMAESQMKLKGAYRSVYDNMKNRLEKSEKITKSRNTQGKLVEVAWKDAKPSHRHGAALRAIMKHFLADWWMVGRTLLGLETSALYPEAILGGNHRTIMPVERGWEY